MAGLASLLLTRWSGELGPTPLAKAPHFFHALHCTPPVLPFRLPKGQCASEYASRVPRAWYRSACRAVAFTLPRSGTARSVRRKLPINTLISIISTLTSIITTCISCGCRDPAPLGQYGGGFTLRLESPNMKVKPSIRPVSSLGCAFVIMLSPAFGLRRETALPAGEGRCLREFHADRQFAGLGRHRYVPPLCASAPLSHSVKKKGGRALFVFFRRIPLGLRAERLGECPAVVFAGVQPRARMNAAALASPRSPTRAAVANASAVC